MDNEKNPMGFQDKTDASGIDDGRAAAGSQRSSDCSLNEEVRLEIIKKLKDLDKQLSSTEDIAEILRDVPLKCLKPSTTDSLCMHLDPLSDVPAESTLPKDYRGMAEWIGLETIFIRWISNFSRKTQEILNKWMALENCKHQPTIRNLRECLIGQGGIERPDVLSDLAVKISKDAIQWKLTEFEAQTRPSKTADISWQLTRHDVDKENPTRYIACLLYADEDYGMAQLITDLYKAVYKDMTFFNPQMDMNTGKYIYDTIAKVIDERCGGKVVFLLSQYFLASKVCQFAVNFAASKGTGNGNLIPFNLTRDVEHVPSVLKGITGIRWFRAGTREHAWSVLTDCLLGQNERMSPEKLERLKENTNQLVTANTSLYLCDPPYDADVQPPGIPIAIDESAPITLSTSSSTLLECTSPSLEGKEPDHKPSSSLFLKRAIKLFFFKKWWKLLSKKNITNPRTTQNQCRDNDNIELDTGSNDAQEMVTLSTSIQTEQCEHGGQTIGAVSEITENDTPANRANFETIEDADESDVLIPPAESSQIK